MDSFLSSSSSFGQLLSEDLKLQEWQTERRTGANIDKHLQDTYLEVDCLVHSDWLSSVVSPCSPLPQHIPPFTPEKVHWMLQPSCSREPELPWQRVHICCYKKCGGNGRGQRFLVPKNDFAVDSLHTFLTTVSQEMTLSSWRNLSEKLETSNNTKEKDTEEEPCPDVTNDCYTSLSTVREPFMHQLVKELYDKELRPVTPLSTSTPEEHILQKTISNPSQDFNSEKQGRETLSPLIAGLESEKAFYLIFPYHRFSLFDCVVHSPAMLENSTKRPLFILYQILKMLSFTHSKGLTLGDINLKNIYVDGRLWVQYYLPPQALCSGKPPNLNRKTSLEATPIHAGTPVESTTPTKVTTPTKNDAITPLPLLSDAVIKWRNGELSNFDYIMLLNYYAGRRQGDPNNHPIFPWVTDFAHKNGNLRDLSLSKHRLAKGDRQLDFTYQSALEEVRRSSMTSFGAVIPHHIGDIASDVTYYVYVARKTPKEVLTDRVRPRWVPEEYPLTISKLYDWTPDECIPEFYNDPSIFYSIHSDLPDLGVPKWAGSPEEFVTIHRQLLESDAVSCSLHNWFDLVFGNKLVGDSAVKAKNVYLSLVDGHSSPKSSGIVQLFRSAHPKKVQTCSAPLVVFQWQHYLAMSSLLPITSFNINQTPPINATPPKDDKRTLASIIDDGKSLSSRHHKNDSQGGIDDGSFEHVGYPNEGLDSFTVAESGFYNEDTYDISVLTPSTKGSGVTGPGKGSDTAVLAAEPGNKQGILRILRPRRPVIMETNENFDWQFTNIAIPKDTPPLQPLVQIEELSHFLNKSCRDFTNTYTQWVPDDLLMLQDTKDKNKLHKQLSSLLEEDHAPNHTYSFKDRVLMDLVSVVCLAVEMTCNKYLRAALPLDSSLSVRYKTIRQLLSNGQFHIPYNLQPLTDLIFIGYSDPPLVPLIIPSLTSACLIQQFIPLLSFPSYFEPLYLTLSEFEKHSKVSGLATPPIKPKRSLDMGGAKDTPPDHATSDPAQVIQYIGSQLDIILPQLDKDGLHLFMLYIFPLFEHPNSCFEAIFNLFDTLSNYLSRRWIQQVMIPCFLYAFDTFEKPSDNCRLLNRSMAEKLISIFGLRVFLVRFLNCIMEAVIEPLSKKMRGEGVTSERSRFLNTVSRRERDRGGEGERSEGGKVSLSRLSNSLSQSLVLPNSTPSLSYSWEDRHMIGGSDEEGERSDDSDDEADLSFPEASILVSSKNNASSIFGIMSDFTDQAEEDSEMGGANQSETTPTKRDSLQLDYPPPIFEPRPTSTSFSNTNRTKDILPDSLKKHNTQSLSNRHSNEPLPVVNRNNEKPHNQNLLPNRHGNGSHSNGSHSNGSRGNDPLYINNKSMEDDENPLPRDNRISLDEELLLPSTKEGVVPSRPSIPLLLSNESLEEKEREEERKDLLNITTSPSAVASPQMTVISSHIAEVASDCLVWLLWRLGPLLATKHIIHPLLDNFHRCFTNISHTSKEKSSASNVLSVLAAMVDYYGEDIVGHLYIPFIKRQVAYLSKRTTLSIKTEASLSGSVALLEMSVTKSSQDILLGYMEDLSIKYFKPLFEVLSSKRLTFPSGAETRVTICHSSVELLKIICGKLGRDRSGEVMMDALQSFFNCFSSAHGKNKPKGNNGILTPVEGYFTDDNNSKKFLPSPTSAPVIKSTNEIINNNNGDFTTPIEEINPSAVDEVTKAFSPLMVHKAYVDFCKLIGQISLTNHLQNIDVIEELHASYSKEGIHKTENFSVSLLGLSGRRGNSGKEGGDSSESDSSIESDTDSESNLDITYQLGPSAALTGRRGLCPDSSSFGNSSWFVDMDDNEVGMVTSGGAGEGPQSERQPVVSGGFVSTLRNTLTGSVAPPTKASLEAMGAVSMGGVETSPVGGGFSRGSALFDAKFGSGTALPGGWDNSAEQLLEINQSDCKLKGSWSELWQNHADHGVSIHNVYNKFEGLRLQSYAGHKSTIKCLYVQDSEHIFLSGSKDKTIKIWSLHNQGNGTALCTSRQSYNQHQRTVTNVSMIGHHQALSCDGNVHLWDTETACCLHQFTSPRVAAQFLSMETLRDSPTTAIVATGDSHLRFIDVRTKNLQHLWRTHFQTGGSIRFLANFSTWLVIGNINGVLNIIDIRTGELLHSWKPADKWPIPPPTWSENLFQLKVTDRGNILTSAGAGLVSLWKPNSRPLNHFRGQTSNTSCLETFGEELVTISNNGQALVHGSFEFVRDNIISVTKIKPKEFRGSITCSASLPLNQLLLLGSDTGQLVLMA